MKEFTHLEQQKQQKQTQKRHAGTISIFVLFYNKFFYKVCIELKKYHNYFGQFKCFQN